MGTEVNSEGTTLLPDITVTDSRPNWEQWGERVNEMFGQSLGWDFDEYAKTHWYDGMSDWLSDAWNSPYARMMIQDKYSISIGGDFAAILGVGAQPINFSILMRGKEPGIYLTPSFTINAGAGFFVSGGINVGASIYTGDPRNITSDMLSGDTYGGILNGGYIGDLSVGVSFSPTSNRNGFYNANVGVGIGYGIFGGYQYQYTVGAIPIWNCKR